MNIARINGKICISFDKNDEKAFANEVKLVEEKVPQLRGRVLSTIAEIFRDDLKYGGCSLDNQKLKKGVIAWDIVCPD